MYSEFRMSRSAMDFLGIGFRSINVISAVFSALQISFDSRLNEYHHTCVDTGFLVKLYYQPTATALVSKPTEGPPSSDHST